MKITSPNSSTAGLEALSHRAVCQTLLHHLTGHTLGTRLQDGVVQPHTGRAVQHAPSTGCFWQPAGDSPSHNQGSRSLKQALLFPLSCFPFPWALLSQPFHLSPGSLGLTTLLLSKPLASLLALPVFIFRGFLLLFLATEAAAAFLRALSLGCCFLGPLGGTARFLGHGLTGTIKCVPASSWEDQASKLGLLWARGEADQSAEQAATQVPEYLVGEEERWVQSSCQLVKALTIFCWTHWVTYHQSNCNFLALNLILGTISSLIWWWNHMSSFLPSTSTEAPGMQNSGIIYCLQGT